jgi:hypothetical protein
MSGFVGIRLHTVVDHAFSQFPPTRMVAGLTFDIGEFTRVSRPERLITQIVHYRQSTYAGSRPLRSE